jgi:hypothetical protein
VIYLIKLGYCEFENFDNTDFGQYWYTEIPVPQLFIGAQSNLFIILCSIYMIVVSTSSYLISMFLAKKTVDELNEKFSYLSFTTKTLQNQLAR